MGSLVLALLALGSLSWAVRSQTERGPAPAPPAPDPIVGAKGLSVAATGGIAGPATTTADAPPPTEQESPLAGGGLSTQTVDGGPPGTSDTAPTSGPGTADTAPSASSGGGDTKGGDGTGVMPIAIGGPSGGIVGRPVADDPAAPQPGSIGTPIRVLVPAFRGQPGMTRRDEAGLFERLGRATGDVW